MRPARRRRRLRELAARTALAAALVVPAAAQAPAAADASPAQGTFRRPFPQAGWLYDRIPAAPALDPDSAAMVANLREGQHVANLHEFGIPFHAADAATTRKRVNCTKPWGTCDLEAGRRRLNRRMRPHRGSDRAMVVVDKVRRVTDEYWRYSWNDGRPRTAWGGVGALDGDGLGVNATGALISRAAGVVRAFEIRQGHIDHALVFSTSHCGASYRHPAGKSDGGATGPGAVPEGARIQLRPSLDPDDYRLSKAERAVFVALQRYGAYAIDCGGASAAFSFQEVAGNPGGVYRDAGLAWDYFDLRAIPWGRIRVLRSWDGR
ncbi:MAG: hypothetical protein KY434_03485 [Actinobacteria bacterium]|nr:hypothetical protein [Actinomycetota bacterium]